MKGKIKKVILWSITAIIAISASVYGINNYVNVTAEETIEGKELISNGDGTYTLSLSATGASEKKVNKANVVVVFDVSGSMNSKTYAKNNQGGYGLRNGEYISLYYRTGSGSFWSPYQYHEIGDSTYDGTVYRSNGYNSYTQYTGDRYESTGTRLSAAKTAVTYVAIR